MLKTFVSSDDIRSHFAAAMSEMYRREVPQYDLLLELVSRVNDNVLKSNPPLRRQLAASGDLHRLSDERHGAIRLGTSEELSTIRRIFAVMGMFPVDYYDLVQVGLPVCATAFRPVTDVALARNPFRMFTSLLQLDLIERDDVRSDARKALGSRSICSRRLLQLLNQAESDGLTQASATEFISEAVKTFKWHSEATVSAERYLDLSQSHPLVADIVSFQGPHINHLTPRTLDIDAVQSQMPLIGMTPKDAIEGPPRRRCPILLRQTSFLALDEPILFINEAGGSRAGSHTARFGEIEQRGAALTPQGRNVYDTLLNSLQQECHLSATPVTAAQRKTALERLFATFPDTHEELRASHLAYYRYRATDLARRNRRQARAARSLDELIVDGQLDYAPCTYEDFLPVSAAGIFQSNLRSNEGTYEGNSRARSDFEQDLGAKIINAFDLYAELETASLARALDDVGASRLMPPAVQDVMKSPK